MAHGVTLASDSFTILNANESIGFIMADAGAQCKHDKQLLFQTVS
jgi:hypothetical protein